MPKCDHATYVEGCRRCWLYEHDPKYRRLWGGDPRTAAPDLNQWHPCRWEGEVVEWARCGSPWRHVRECLYEGWDHDRCTRGPNNGTVPSCHCCPHYDRPGFQPDRIGTVRHLLYHVYPVAGNGTWQRNLDRLTPRLGLFNGRKIVAVVTEEPKAERPLDPPEAVEEYLRGSGCETFRMVNDKRLREVTTLVPLLHRVADLTGPEHATFYGQSKGVTRPFDPGTTVHRWASLSLELNLDYWPAVQALLRTHPAVGAFKKVGAGFRGSASRWHFTGTFWWFRNADLFARNWLKVDQAWWGAESYPGVQFRPDEAGAVAMSGPVQTLDLYDWNYFTNTVEPEVRAWTSRHTSSRTGTGSSRNGSTPNGTPSSNITTPT